MTSRGLAYLCLEAPREGQASFVHVREIIAGLERRDWTVTLYSPSYSGRWERPRLSFRLAHYALLQIRLAWRWRRHDAIYVRAHPAAFPTALLARWTGKAILHEVNGPLEDLYIVYPGASRWRRLLDWSQRQQYRWATALVAVTNRLSLWLREETKDTAPTVVTISNGANIQMFNSDAGTARMLPEQYAVFCGGLTQWHGVATMLAAVSDPAWPKGMPLVIVGDGPESAAVAAAAEKNSLIRPLGRLPYDDVPGVLAKARVGLVSISDPRGRSALSGVAPLKLYEVLACGVPVIVTDLPGLADFVSDYECGMVVPVDDSGALAKAVAAMMSDPARASAMGLRGQGAVTSHHSWDSRAADTDVLLRSVCGETVPASGKGLPAAEGR